MQTFRKSQIPILAIDLMSYDRDRQKLKNNSIICFVGITGSGKSSIINHMLGHNLIVQKIHGTRQIVLENQEGENKATIGKSLTKSCTRVPQLYSLQNHKNMLLCDTAGFNDQGPNSQNCQLLNQMYLTKAQRIICIVFVININDLRSQRGGGFNAIFQQLERIANFNQVKKKMQFIINYKNSQEDDLQDLFAQLVQYEKQNQQSNVNPEKIQAKRRFFSTIFDKDSVNEISNMEKFINKIMICTKKQLTNKDSQLKKTFFQRIGTMSSKHKLQLNPSKARILLTKHITRGILARQSSLQKCIAKYQLYYKSKIIEINFWNQMQVTESNSNQKAKILSDTLLSTFFDQQLVKNIINQLDAQIDQFNTLGKQCFKSSLFQPNQDLLFKQQQVVFTLNLNYQIKNIIKQVQGYTIVSQNINLKQGKYNVKFLPIQSSPIRKIKIMSIASFEDRDKTMMDFLFSQKKRFEMKLNSKNLLDNLPFKKELDILVDIVKRKKQQSDFLEFVQKYSLNDQQMFRALPTKQQIQLYKNELQIYTMIISNVDVKKQCIQLIFLQKLNKIPFLSETPCKGYCSINNHLINNLVRLQCGHDYQEYCWKKMYENDKGTYVQQNCIVCGQKAVKIDVNQYQKAAYKQKFKDFFRKDLKK